MFKIRKKSFCYQFVVFILFLIITPNLSLAQKYTISGFIEDASSGERLIAATIFDQISKQGTSSNVFGFYSLNLNQGIVKIRFSYVGYQPKEIEFNLTEDTTIVIAIEPTLQLTEFVVKSERTSIIDKTQSSIIEIPIKAISSLPVLFGERDVLKAIQLFPGVQSGSEGTAGIYVRGGGPDQNLVLLDGVPVYNAEHLFGFFSIFNPDAISHVTLIKGGFPARYGGRLSSVIDIRMKEGNNKEYQGEVSVGVISSKFTFEGPIIKNKSSFIISARRTYLDLLTMPIIRMVEENTTAGYYFYDFNAKFNYIISNKDRLFLSVYTGKDKFYFNSKYDYFVDDFKYESAQKSNISWGNITTALRWNHVFNSKMFSNVTATYSRFNFNVGQSFSSTKTQGNLKETSEYMFDYFSGIYDLALKADFEYHLSPKSKFMFGISDIYHTFTPGSTIFKYTSNQDVNINQEFQANKVFAHQLDLYVENETSISPKLKINPGLRFSAFLVQGESYTSIQPRLNTRYLINENTSVKLAFSQMNQHIHLLTNSGIGLPTDLWLPSTKRVKPQKSVQYALGFYRNITEDIEVSIEGYYKDMYNLIEYKEGADFFGIYDSWEDKIEIGKGNAYGTEFLIRKHSGKTSGWIGYTLSWSNRQFENLNFGKPFPYRYDRRHDIGIAISHKLNQKIDFGLVYVFGTGNAVSLPIEKYPSHLLNINNNFNTSVLYYDGRNGYRTPAYHRLDASVNVSKDVKLGRQTWSFGVYNLYNRQNPFMIYFDEEYVGNQSHTVLKQLSLFPIIPSVSYNLKFKIND